MRFNHDPFSKDSKTRTISFSKYSKNFEELFIPKIHKIHISRSSLVETIKERAEKFGKVIIEEGARCEKKKVCGAATGAVSQ